MRADLLATCPLFSQGMVRRPLKLQSQRPATGLRTPKSPKVPGRVLGRVPGKRGLLGRTAGSSAGRPVSLEKQRNGTAPSSPPSSPLFPGTLPSTLPGTFGDLGVLSPVAGRWDSNTKDHFRHDHLNYHFYSFKFHGDRKPFPGKSPLKTTRA